LFCGRSIDNQWAAMLNASKEADRRDIAENENSAYLPGKFQDIRDNHFKDTHPNSPLIPAPMPIVRLIK
jgi:hypothetical protein